MLNIPILKQDFLINKKAISIFYLLQVISLLLAAGIRNMRLIQISDCFWDTFPVVVIPMLMGMTLVCETVKKREADKSMVFILSTGTSPAAVITTKAVFVVLNLFLLFAFSMFFGGILHVYDLTGVWNWNTYVILNIGGMCLQVFLGGWCFLVSCMGKNGDIKFYTGLGIGLPILFYLIYLLGDMVPELGILRYVTVFSLFRQQLYAAPSIQTFVQTVILAIAGAVFFGLGRYAFCRRTMKL